MREQDIPDNKICSGERITAFAEDQKLSPTEAVPVFGISRPLVVDRMDISDLPFRYVGKHRHAWLKDVMALKVGLDIRQKALDVLAEDTEDLVVSYNVYDIRQPQGLRRHAPAV